MVNIQVFKQNEKIETVRCGENEIVRHIEKYGEIQETQIEKDTSKKTTMIRYHISTETHRIIVSMTISQAERVNDYIASYEAFAEVFNETETENEGDEKMEKYIGIKYLNTGNRVEMIIEAENWDEAIFKMGSITAFDDRVVDWTCDLATDEDVSSVAKKEERKALELRLSNLQMMAFEYKKMGFGEHQVVKRTPYDDEISEIRRKLGEL